MKKYYANLIPDEYRVLPDYFKNTPQELRQSNWNIVMWLISIILLIAAVTIITINIWFSLCLFTTAFLISPWGSKLIESTLRFDLTSSLKLKTLGFITIFTFFTGKEYFNQLGEIQKTNLLVKIEQEKIKKEREKQYKIRLDSLNYYIANAKKYQASKNYKKAITFFLKVNKDSLLEDKSQINLTLANLYFEVKDYKNAIIIFDTLETNDGDIYYKRGICNKNIGDVPNAIKNFKQAVELGNNKANREYNKINPIIKELLYYQTVCCDGTYSPSNAKGRGACSHHGGVCNWNKPIYEEHRKYEISNF